MCTSFLTASMLMPCLCSVSSLMHFTAKSRPRSMPLASMPRRASTRYVIAKAPSPSCDRCFLPLARWYPPRSAHSDSEKGRYSNSAENCSGRSDPVSRMENFVRTVLLGERSSQREAFQL